MKIIIFMLYFSLVIIQRINAQSEAILQADDSYDYFQFNEAIQLYEQVLNNVNPKYEAHVLTRLAESHMFLFQYKKAEGYFSKLVRLGDRKAQPQSYLDYGNVLKANGKYEEAKDQFKYYLTLVKGDPYVSSLLRSLNWAILNKDSVTNYQIIPTNLDITGQAIGYDFLKGGLVYAHGRNKKAYYSMPIFDLDYALMVDSLHFVQGENYFEEINFAANETSPSLSKDGSLLFFSANAIKQKKDGKLKNGKQDVQESRDGVSNLQIYMAVLQGVRYRNPVLLNFNNRQYNFTHPYLTADGKTLFFASDMPGGYGGFDIFKVNKQADGSWGNPINMGSKVNSDGNELHPYVSNGVLFFASKGLNGFGGYDIFRNNLEKNYSARNPSKNMGKPINSERDELAFITKDGGITGYFSSNREGDLGEDRVYYFNNKASYKKPYSELPVAIKLEPSAIKGADKIEQKSSSISVLESAKNVPVSQSKVEITKIVLEPVPFNFNESSIQMANLSLDSVIQIMKANPNVRLLVIAHTDSRGSYTYNKNLSRKRAASVSLHLNSRGISSSRIKLLAMGEEQLLNKCTDGLECAEEEHAVNRRVELKLIK